MSTWCSPATWSDPAGPARDLARWFRLVRPGGRLVLVEGRWLPAGATTPYARGAEAMPWQGVALAKDLVAALHPLVDWLEVTCLSTESALWGREVDDERHAVVATTPGQRHPEKPTCMKLRLTA